MLVVVVLPWVPATAIVGRRALSSASRSARWSSVRPRSRARRALGVVGRDGGRVDDLDAVAAGRLAASWPTAASMPAARSALEVRATRPGLSR